MFWYKVFSLLVVCFIFKNKIPSPLKLAYRTYTWYAPIIYDIGVRLTFLIWNKNWGVWKRYNKMDSQITEKKKIGILWFHWNHYLGLRTYIKVLLDYRHVPASRRTQYYKTFVYLKAKNNNRFAVYLIALFQSSEFIFII